MLLPHLAIHATLTIATLSIATPFYPCHTPSDQRPCVSLPPTKEPFLPDIYRSALRLGSAATAERDGAAAAAALRLMAAVLAWDFRRSPSFGARGAGGAAAAPPPDWAGLLLSSEALGWVVQLNTQLAAAARGAGGGGGAGGDVGGEARAWLAALGPAGVREMLSRARGVAVALSGLSGDALPREGGCRAEPTVTCTRCLGRVVSADDEAMCWRDRVVAGARITRLRLDLRPFVCAPPFRVHPALSRALRPFVCPCQARTRCWAPAAACAAATCVPC